MLFPPAHLFLHLLLSEVQRQEVEVLRLLPLSGVRKGVSVSGGMEQDKEGGGPRFPNRPSGENPPSSTTPPLGLQPSVFHTFES